MKRFDNVDNIQNFSQNKKKSKSKLSAHHVSEKGLKFVGFRQSFIIIGVEIAHGLGERIKIKNRRSWKAH